MMKSILATLAALLLAGNVEGLKVQSKLNAQGDCDIYLPENCAKPSFMCQPLYDDCMNPGANGYFEK